jgi:hypothetical protein
LSEIQRADPIAGFAFDSPRAWYERTRRDHGSRVSIYLGLDQPGSERGTPVAGRRRAEPWSLDLLQLLYGTACRDRECCYCDGYIYPLREFSALESIAQVAWFDTICGERA